MRVPSLVLLSAIAASTLASPLRSPRSSAPPSASNFQSLLPFQDGFPNTTDSQLQAIELKAQGVLPEGSPGTSLSPDGATAFQLFEFASIVSAAFYDQLLANITASTPSFDLPTTVDKDTFTCFLEQAKAVEELHALSSIHALGHFNATPLSVCPSYDFPVSSLDEALRFGIILQSNLIGAISGLAVTWAQEDQYALVSIISGASAVIGQQLASLRSAMGLSAIQSPFSTPSTAGFTYTYLLSLVDTVTCPNITSLPLQQYPTLQVVNPSTINTQTTSIQVQLVRQPWDAASNYSVVYLNGASAPIAQPATYVSEDDKSVWLEAALPYSEASLDGVSVVLVSNVTLAKYGPVQNATDNAIWAPGFVLVN